MNWHVKRDDQFSSSGFRIHHKKRLRSTELYAKPAKSGRPEKATLVKNLKLSSIHTFRAFSRQRWLRFTWNWLVLQSRVCADKDPRDQNDQESMQKVRGVSKVAKWPSVWFLKSIESRILCVFDIIEWSVRVHLEEARGEAPLQSVYWLPAGSAILWCTEIRT